jgi:hypothetical protein
MRNTIRWATACGKRIGLSEEEIEASLSGNHSRSARARVQSYPFLKALLDLMNGEEIYYRGRASDWLYELTILSSESAKSKEGWPRQANYLSRMLRELTVDLRSVGIFVICSERASNHERTRGIELANFDVLASPSTWRDVEGNLMADWTRIPDLLPHAERF